VAFAAANKRAYLWQTETGVLITAFTFDQAAFAIKFSPDGKRLAAAGAKVVVVLEAP